MSLRSRWTGLLLLFAANVGSTAEPPVVDGVMYQDPTFHTVAQLQVYFDQVIPTWNMALERPETEVKRVAADSISLAHALGMPGLEATSPGLVRLVADREQPSNVALAAAKALVALDQKQAAGALYERQAIENLDFAQVVEPKLGRWAHQATIDSWLQRLDTPDTPRARLLMAIAGLAEAGEAKAEPGLAALVNDARNATQVRLAAARGLANVRTSGLAPQAQRLIAGSRPPLISRLLACALLAEHSDAESVALLRTLGEDDSGAVAATALGRLYEIDPSLIYDLAEKAIANTDVNVRRLALRTLAAREDEATIVSITPLMGDHNPSLRRETAGALVELAKSEALRSIVVREVNQLLGVGQWRSLEQACLVLATLDFKPAAPRCIELLAHERPEVYITAAWALRKLRLPETLPALFKAAEIARAFDPTQQGGGASPGGLDRQCSQCFQAFGEMGYREAEALMREYIPKSDFPEKSRAAAIWSLGLFFEGEAPKDLTAQFVSRLNDVESAAPDFALVRQMCAVSLGRMKSEAALPALRRFTQEDGRNHPVGFSCYWAIERILGEPIPDAEPSTYRKVDWFLVPLNEE